MKMMMNIMIIIDMENNFNLNIILKKYYLIIINF